MSDNPVYLPIYCKVTQLGSDGEAYKPSAPVIQLDITVVVHVPLTNKYVANCDKILLAQLNNEKEPEPVFYPEGLRYIEKRLLSRQSPDAVDPDNKTVAWTEDEFEDSEF